MNYYRLVLKNQDEECTVVNDYDLKGFDHRKLWRSEKIDDWRSDIRLNYDKNGLVLDYMPNVLSWLIFSGKIVEIIKELNIPNVQMFPVTLYKKDNEDQTLNYNVINLMTKVAAMDWGKSDYLAWEDDPKFVKVIRRLVIKQSAVKDGLEMFNLAEATPYVVVSENVKYAFESKGITGADFWSIEVN